MQIKRINNSNEALLKSFLESCSSSLATFRYFQSRPLSIIENHLATFLAIDDTEHPVAYGHLDPENGIVWLGICVSDKYQGKGYGDLMMKALVDETARLNIHEINLTVDKVNLPAIHLYDKYGFKMIKESEKIFWYRWTSLK